MLVEKGLYSDEKYLFLKLSTLYSRNWREFLMEYQSWTKKEAKKDPKENEEDEMDLFGEDGEEEAAAKAELAAKAKDTGKKKKAPPVAKSLIIWDIKPWGPETDLDELGKKIINEIEMPGL